MASADDWDSTVGGILDQESQDQDSQVRNNLISASGSNADNEAQIQHLARFMGVPPDTAREEQPVLQAQAAAASADKISTTHPQVASFLAKPENAAIAHDDVPNLKAIHDTAVLLGQRLEGDTFAAAQGLGGSFNKLLTGFSLALGTAPMLYDKAASLMTGKPTTAAQDWYFHNFVDPWTQQASAFDLQSNPWLTPGRPAPFDAQAMQSAGGLLGLLSQAVTGGEAQPADTVAGAVSQALQHGTKAMAIPALSNAVDTGRRVYAQTGDGRAAANAAAAEYMSSTAMALVPLSAPGRRLTRLAGGAVSGLASGELAHDWMNAALPDSMQQAPLTTDDRILNALTMSLMAGVAGPRPEPAYHEAVRQTYVNAARANATDQTISTVAKLGQLSAQSKVRTRDPERFKQFVQDVTEGGKLDSVYVDSKDFLGALNQSSVSVPELQRTMPEVASQLHEAMQTGGDIRIPVADYATHIAGGKVEQALLPKLKADPAGPTYEQAQAHQQNLVENLQAEAAQVAADQADNQDFAAGAQQVHDTVLGQLDTAGRFRPEVNKAYASVVRDFYTTQAARLGLRPEELYAKYPLQIQAESLPGAGDLEQPSPPEIYRGIKRADVLSPEDRVIETAHIDRTKQNVDKAIEQYAALPDTRGGMTLNTDEARELAPEYRANRTKSAAVHEPASWLTKEMYRRALEKAKAKPGGTVTISAGGTGAGKTSGLRKFGLEKGLVFDTNMNKLDSATKKIEDALAAKQKVHVAFTYRDPVDALVNGALSRAMNREAQPGGGRTVPLKEHEATHTGSVAVIRQLMQRYARDPRVQFTVIDNTHGREGAIRVPSLESLPVKGYTDLRGDLRAALEQQRASGAISDRIYRGFLDAEPSGSGEVPGGVRSDGRGDFEQSPRGESGVGSQDRSSARGRISFGQGIGESPSTIALLKNADLSTFLHETGHFFLEATSHIAAQPDAPAGIKSDFDSVLKWFGVKDAASWQAMSLDQKREFHEKFARGFESYLMEGKAPSVEAAGLFGKFRQWLLHVYQSFKSLNVSLTPEVRGVMDRMLASDQAIKHAERVRGYQPLFESAKAAGMTPEQFARYQEQGAAASERAVEELQSRGVKDMRWLSNAKSRAMRKLQATADRQREAIKAEVTQEVMSQPVYKAREFLKTAPKTNPDAAAEMFGFKSGDDLKQQLADADPAESVIEGMTDQRMLEQHGDLATPDAIERAAEAAIHNEARARFVASELKALAKAAGPARDILKAAKLAAETAVNAKRVRDLLPGRYAAAEAKAAKAAEDALKKGQTAQAAVEKRSQILNNQLFKAASRALDDVQKGVEYLKRFDKPSVREGIDLEYRDQIDALLDRFDLRKSVSNAALDKRQTLSAFVERMAAQGYEPGVPEYLLDEARRAHYKDMTAEQFRGLVDGVKSIEHLGKLKSRLQDLKEQRELDAVAAEAQDTTAKLPQHAPESNRGLTRMSATWMKSKAAGRSAQAALLKMEQMFDWLDGRNPNGVFNRVVFRRIADAGVHEAELHAQVTEKLNALMHDEVLKDAGRIYEAKGLLDSATGEPLRLTKKELLGMAGNVGNESNMAKMLAGEKWDEAEVWRFLHENMTKADWDFVQGVGDTLESLWPEKLAMSRRLGNTNPEKIAPRAVTTPHGDYKGWYWPLVYDPARSQDVAERGARKGDELFENIYQRANTDTGRMNTRNENYARPLLLSIDAIPRVIRDEIHDIAYREPIIDADKFLSDSRVRKAIIGALSQEHYDQLRPWLQSIANDGRLDDPSGRAIKFFYGIASGARRRATMVGLGFRFSTMLVHGASAGLESLAELGPRWLAAGVKDFANPTQWIANKDFVFDRSGEMRNRMNEVDRDVREHLRQLEMHSLDPATGAAARGLDAVKRNAYMGIAMLDMASALPTWMGAYHKALSPTGKGGLGLSEDEAVYFADKTVRNAHGGTGVKDLAAVQRGNEMWKLFTMFYTFWNHNVNRLMDTARLAGGIGRSQNFGGDLGQIVMRSLIYTFGIQIMHSALHPSQSEEGAKNWFGWAAKELTSAFADGIPIARDLASHYIEGKDYEATPAASAVDTFDRTAKDAAQIAVGQPPSDKWLKHTINTAGYVFGLPIGQAANTVQFLWDVAGGRQSPQDVADWWNGVINGDMKPHH